MTAPETRQEGLRAAALSRRRFLTLTGAAGGLALSGALVGLGESSTQAAGSPLRMGDDLFKLGVASGDPLPNAVVIWTRLAPMPLENFAGMPQRPVEVQWEVAEDELFRRVVRSGKTVAAPEWSHSVHIDVRGLKPGRHYWYRFRAAGQISPVGRTKTTPAFDALVASASFALASCQGLYGGYYTAHADMAEQDLDAVLFGGDYMYEIGGERGGGGGAAGERIAMSLDDYRWRYSLYKSDPDLQASHAAFPWIITMDDHEVADNWATPPSPDEFAVRQANAFRAYWENMPFRLAQRPKGPDMQLYRRFKYGQLADIHVMDTRSYRDPAPKGALFQPPNEESRDPSRTITGDRQEKWLLDGFARSTATWNLMSHQTAMARIDTKSGPELSVLMDAWDGYEASRNRVLQGAIDRGVENFVSLGGDLHRTVASELTLNFDNPEAPAVATEIIGTSISSGGDGVDMDESGKVIAESPHVRFTNSKRGYALCTVTPDNLVTDFRIIDQITTRGGTASVRKSLTIESGTPGFQE